MLRPLTTARAMYHTQTCAYLLYGRRAPGVGVGARRLNGTASSLTVWPIMEDDTVKRLKFLLCSAHQYSSQCPQLAAYLT